jgi:hypothetical protein
MLRGVSDDSCCTHHVPSCTYNLTPLTPSLLHMLHMLHRITLPSNSQTGRRQVTETQLILVLAGNSFLGGYIAGLSLSSGDPYEAALYATVSASFVVEQFGLPVLNPEAERGSEPGSSKGEEQGDRGAHERWNGDSPWNRLDALRGRLGAT